jgi:hypothetical protein
VETYESKRLMDEAKLLCWLIAKVMDDAINDTGTPQSFLVQLSAMLQSVTQLMIGRSHPAILVANDLTCALARVERHGINLELGDAVNRFILVAHECTSEPTSTVGNEHSVAIK